MAYVRVTVLTPREGSRDRVQQVQDQLLAFFAKQEGFIDGYRLLADDRVGRVTIWDSVTLADATANNDHVLSLRSQLLPLVQKDEELAFEGERVPR